MKRRYYYGQEKSIENKIIEAVLNGHTMTSAARLGGIHRTTLHRWLKRKEGFSERFREAWKKSEKARDYLSWLNHPFRGKRPPTSKRTRSFPRYGRPRR